MMCVSRRAERPSLRRSAPGSIISPRRWATPSRKSGGLAERAVSLQDLERKEIAHELHDEFGPYLFALRAHVGALMRQADAHEPDKSALRRHGGAILDQVNDLQQLTRRILEKLRPVGLAELGVRAAVGGLL